MSKIGQSISCLVGYSNNETNRIMSSSGGIIREIYEYLLRENIVDGVLIVVQENKRFLTRVATEVEDLKEMENSVYAPVKFSPGLKEMQPGKQYAVTCISCQYKKLIPYLDRIKYTFGLLCRGTYQYEAMDIFANHMGIKEYDSFNFRRNGWPGEIEIISSNEKHTFFRWPSIVRNPRLRSAKEGAFCKTTYLPKCMDCRFSFSCEEADISFGDAWLPEFANDRKGYSLVVTRKQHGDELIQDMMKKGLVHLYEPDISAVEESLNDPNYNRWHDFKVTLFKNGNGWILPYIHFFDEFILGFPKLVGVFLSRAYNKISF